MLMTWLRCALSWLAVLFSRSSRTAVVPGTECAHDHDPEALMHQLLLAAHDPPRFAEILAQFANCRGCSTAVIAECIYTLAAVALDQDQQESDGQPPDIECACAQPVVVPEVVAMRLALAFDAHDGDVLGMTLAQIWGCTNCLFNVIVALVRANVTILDDTKPSWRPGAGKRLATTS